jgi:hypothetical protein
MRIFSHKLCNISIRSEDRIRGHIDVKSVGSVRKKSDPNPKSTVKFGYAKTK